MTEKGKKAVKQMHNPPGIVCISVPRPVMQALGHVSLVDNVPDVTYLKKSATNNLLTVKILTKDTIKQDIFPLNLKTNLHKRMDILSLRRGIILLQMFVH